MASLTVGSLFSGIGGLDLGLERAGHRVLWHSEIDDYACRVLKKHWPHVPNIGDVKKVNWSEVPYVDIIAGGYPCQPFSTAGRRKGKEDPRHLWPYVLDAIRELRPRFALMENVRGHLSLGFGDVLADLASSGYSAEWQVIPASSVGAPHRRDRLFVVAYSSLGDGRDSESYGMGEVFGQASKSGERSRKGGTFGGRWEAEPDVGRVADGVPARVERLRGLGNAVVPQVAEVVGRLIARHADN